MSRCILVTGGCGFIGSHIVRSLAERGDRVILLDLHPPAAEAAYLFNSVSDKVTFVRGTVDQWQSVVATVERHRPEAIVHTAAIGDPAAVQYHPQLALRVNLEGSINVLEAARIFDVRRTVLFSSIGVLPGVRSLPITPDHPVLCSEEGPGSGFYGASKVAVEAFAFGYRQSFGTDFVIVRPSAVYGFGMRHPIFIKPMVENAVDGLPTMYAHGAEFPRDYTHVADVAQLTLRAIDVDAERLTHRIFYAATGKPLRTAGEVADIVRQLEPKAAIQIGQGLSDSDKLEIRYRGVLCTANAREHLGYEPQFPRLEDGIAEYLNTYRVYRTRAAS